jgi:hypothetical protein
LSKIVTNTVRMICLCTALVATLVLCGCTGSQELEPDSGAVPVRGAPVRAVQVSVQTASGLPAQIDRDPLLDAATDPFVPVSFLAPPQAPVLVERSVATVIIPPAPNPVSPPFPYRYVGRMTGIDGKTVTFVASDQELVQVRVGQTVAGGFRIDAIDQKQIALTYLPLDERAIIATPSAAR